MGMREFILDLVLLPIGVALFLLSLLIAWFVPVFIGYLVGGEIGVWVGVFVGSVWVAVVADAW